MRAFVNELALAEACVASDPAHAPLEELLKARQIHRVLSETLYCARGMPDTEVHLGVSLASIGRTLPHDKVGLLFQWVDKKGPFIEDDRQPIDEDLFVFGGDEVTDLGLGEAARRVVAERPSATLSPIHSATSRFAPDPLLVTHGLEEEPLDIVPVPNFVQATALADALLAIQPKPKTWRELLINARKRFDHLHIGPHCDSILSRHPYSPAAGRRILELLDVLHRLVAEIDDAGKFTPAGEAMRNKYFVGERAWFSSETSRRKASPRTFTFPDPSGDGSLVCFWHGKISTPPFRIHFEWPAPHPSKRLRIPYIGPHL